MCCPSLMSKDFKYCVCLENGKKATPSQCNEIQLALNTIKYPTPHKIHMYFLGDLLIILDFLSRQAQHIKSWLPCTHGLLETECLYLFCQSLGPQIQIFLRKYMTKFLIYKLQMKTDEKYYKLVYISEYYLFLLFDFFMIHGKCIGNYK